MRGLLPLLFLALCLGLAAGAGQVVSLQQLQMQHQTHECFIYTTEGGRIETDPAKLQAAQAELVRMGDRRKLCDVLVPGAKSPARRPTQETVVQPAFFEQAAAIQHQLVDADPVVMTMDGAVLPAESQRGSLDTSRLTIVSGATGPKKAYVSGIVPGAVQADPEPTFRVTGTAGRYEHFSSRSVVARSFTAYFDVRTSNDAMVAFMANADEKSTFAYEIVIGGCGNKCSMVRMGTEGAVQASNRRPGRVSADETRSFWIRVRPLSPDVNSRMHLTVGEGRNAGERQFLSASLPSLPAARLVPAFSAWSESVSFSNVAYSDDGVTCHQLVNTARRPITDAATIKTVQRTMTANGDSRQLCPAGTTSAMHVSTSADQTAKKNPPTSFTELASETMANSAAEVGTAVEGQVAVATETDATALLNSALAITATADTNAWQEEELKMQSMLAALQKETASTN